MSVAGLKTVPKTGMRKSKLKSKLSSNVYKNRGLLWMLLPGFFLLILFNYVPMYGLLIAFKDYHILQGIGGSAWVGFKNFSELFSRSDFTNALRNTIFLSFLRMVFVFPAPIILAILLNEVRHAFFKRSIQSFTYIPYFFSWIILGGMLVQIFSLTGPVNKLLEFIGIAPIEFLTKPTNFVILLTFTAIWQSVGWNSIIFFAAITSIDPELYDAAIIDGANRWQKIRHITLAGIRSTVILMFILSLGSILSGGSGPSLFDQTFNMQNATVYSVSDVLDTYVYRGLGSLDYGISTAAGLFKSLVGLVLILFANKLAHKAGEEGVW